MNRKDRRQLEQQLQQLLDQAASSRDGDRARLLEEGREISDLLAMIDRQGKPSWSYAIALTVGCVLIAGLLWGLRVGEARLVLDVESHTAAFVTSGGWSWVPSTDNSFHASSLEGADNLNGIALPSVSTYGGESWIRFEQGRVRLQRLDVGAGVATQVTSDSGRMILSAAGVPISGKLVVEGPAAGRVGESTSTSSREFGVEARIPETLSFTRRSASISPLVMRGSVASEPWVVGNIPVQQLRFSREIHSGPAETYMGSDIVSGRLQVPDVERTLILSTGDRLSLGGLTGSIVALRVGDTVRLRFVGTASEIELGPRGFARSLMPTYLEYIRGSQPLAFFWGAAVFLWSLGWGAYRTLRSL